MKERIISGAVLVLIVAGALFCTLYFEMPIIITAFLALLSAVGVYEMLYNTGIVKSKLLVWGAVAYSAIVQFLYAYNTQWVSYLSAAYGIFSILLAFYNRKEMLYKRIVMAAVVPVLVSYCFNCINTLLGFGLMHLILLLNFSSICDCGAYFVGVTIGKHKLCPKISPKKTVEGAIGGIALSLIATLIIGKLFSVKETLISLIIITPVLCVAGMIGDLLASVIKRKVGIKDYGKIIPGHGGIMDRFDSILLIAPIYVLLYSVLG